MVGDWVKGNVGNLVLLVIGLVTQERIIMVKPQRGNICFTISPFHHFTIHVVPQERRSIVNPISKSKEEYPRRIYRNILSQRRSELALKGSNSKVPTGDYLQLITENSNLSLKFRARGRVFKDMKRQISLCTDQFSSEPKKWKADRRCYNLKKPPSHLCINSLLCLETNSLLR